MLLGQFDYGAMRALQPELTGFFFFSFTILCNFLLLNFIIAILSDGFASVSKDTALEPLDESLLNQIYVLANYFTYRNLKKILELRKRGKTRIMLLRDMHKHIAEHIALLTKNDDSSLDNEIPMYRRDLKNWLPEQLYADLGDDYLLLLWKDIHRDYAVDAKKKSSNYQLRKDVEDAISKRVALVVRRKVLEGLPELYGSMNTVEKYVDAITSVTTEEAIQRGMDYKARAARKSMVNLRHRGPLSQSLTQSMTVSMSVDH
jgi:hypothetical protein